jgi:transcriptional regulator with GAF, ATPase, and Fis domain
VGDDLILGLVDALSRTHNESTCLRAAHAQLASRYRITTIRLHLDARGETVSAGVASEPSSPTARVPLEEDLAGTVGFFFAPGAVVPDDETLVAVARVLSAALRQIRTLARVAEISRSVHHRSRELDGQVRELTKSRSIVAVSPAMRRIFDEVVPLVARQDTRVLILGETGTGKEVVARRIHELSLRWRRPFVRINCAAIPAGLVESTLFGHERGSFTGATRRQIGVFERAAGGTLLLDEVGELPVASQAKLLRVLESGEIERIGGDRTLAVDVRVIAATHRDLDAMVRERSFRDDLLHRLAVFPICIPPLRERPDDVVALARHLVEDIARRFGRAAPHLDRRSLQALRRYRWPGNVRELENVVERSMILQEGEAFALHLPEPSRSPASVGTFSDAARRSIEAALSAAAGRVYGRGGAAELLGLKPTTLMSKMAKLGVRSIHERGGVNAGRPSRRTTAARSRRA